MAEALLPATLIDISDLNTNMEESWYIMLKDEFSKIYFKNLVEFIKRERKLHTIYPADIFYFTKVTPLNDIKVVILGQDPYHGQNQAHGLSFSSLTSIPPSLANIYIELKNNIPNFKKPTSGNLTKWAEQGVLLLNSVLTVRKNSANSHKGQGWETFTDRIILWVNNNLTQVVFMLWGEYAKQKEIIIDAKRHCILKSAHPSPYSADKGFFKNKHFEKCNKYLEECKKTPINWNV